MPHERTVDTDNPPADCGDYVIAVGCHDIRTTGKKRFQKKYYSHSTRPGSLKELTMDRMIAKFGGAEILRKAVSGMLPKNKLRDVRLSRLKGTFGHGGAEEGGQGEISCKVESCHENERVWLKITHTWGVVCRLVTDTSQLSRASSTHINEISLR